MQVRWTAEGNVTISGGKRITGCTRLSHPNGVWSCELKEVDSRLDIREVWIEGDEKPYHLARWPNRDDTDPSVVSSD